MNPAEGGGAGEVDSGVGAGPGPVAVVVAVGDELLSGRTVDTNSAWLGGSLGGVGVPVVRRYTVGDDPAEIADAVSRGLARAELVLVTGGLGPTHDDRTLEAVAELLHRPLRLDEALVESLETRFLQRGFKALPAANLRQARVPEGATILPNRRGTAPGIQLDLPGRRVVLLPGVPGEMQTLVTEQVLPRLPDLFGERLRPVHSRSLLTSGIAESSLAGLVEPLLASPDFPSVELAFLPRSTGVELRLTAREATGVDAAGEVDRGCTLLAPLVSRWVYRGPDLVDDLAAALLERGSTLATAESCTGGLLGKRLTDLPGSSRWFLGGVVAYANEAKRDLLGVDEGLLLTEGAVSGAVAAAMAEGAMRRLKASAGISITGVAGPGGGSEEKPVGTVWIGVTVEGRSTTALHHFPGNREDIRERSAQAAVQQLLRMLGEP